MSVRAKPIDSLLQVSSSRELQEKAGKWSLGLTLPEAQKLTRHLDSLSEPRLPFRLGVIHTYTSDLMDPWLNFHAAVQSLDLSVYHAPYGMNLMEAQANSGLVRHAPDMTLFLLQREDLHPALNRSIAGLNSAEQEQLMQDALRRLAGILAQFRSSLPGRLVVSFLPDQRGPGLGIQDAQSQQSDTAWWSAFKQQLAAQIEQQLETTTLLDLDEILLVLGRQQFFDARYWYTSRYPFAPPAANEISRSLLDLATVMVRPKAKVIVLDADNTLWGGVIGEEGMHGIALSPDYPGSAYVDFQKRLLDYQDRGFILAMCSKNNHQDVMEVLQDHPHQLLKESSFAAMRINWQPKHENIRSLAAELNLGLDSFIFVDDSDYECGIVRRELPEVQVVQTPAKPLDVPQCLAQVSRLEVLQLTREDRQKTQQYTQERKRRELHQELEQQGGGLDEYLASLNMKMSIEIDSVERIRRMAQLTQKTNQFNLTTRRYDEQQLQQFVAADDWLVASFSLADAYGDSGVVGLALIRYLDAGRAEIDTFLMSCRVIGRMAESAFLQSLLKILAEQGVGQVSATYIETRKNALVADFYANHGFTDLGDGQYFRSLVEQDEMTEKSYPIEVMFKQALDHTTLSPEFTETNRQES